MTPPRTEVQLFADAMEAKLKANDHKGGWKGCVPSWLLRRLAVEVRELTDAVKRRKEGWPPGKIRGEAADVANFAMMIADVCGDLPAPAAPIEANVAALRALVATLQEDQGRYLEALDQWQAAWKRMSAGTAPYGFVDAEITTRALLAAPAAPIVPTGTRGMQPGQRCTRGCNDDPVIPCGQRGLSEEACNCRCHDDVEPTGMRPVCKVCRNRRTVLTGRGVETLPCPACSSGIEVPGSMPTREASEDAKESALPVTGTATPDEVCDRCGASHNGKRERGKPLFCQDCHPLHPQERP